MISHPSGGGTSESGQVGPALCLPGWAGSMATLPTRPPHWCWGTRQQLGPQVALICRYTVAPFSSGRVRVARRQEAGAREGLGLSLHGGVLCKEASSLASASTNHSVGFGLQRGSSCLRPGPGVTWVRGVLLDVSDMEVGGS